MSADLLTITIGSSTYKITNTPERIASFYKKLEAANKPMRTEAKKMAAAYNSQTRMNATPAERARVMSDPEIEHFIDESEYPARVDVSPEPLEAVESHPTASIVPFEVIPVEPVIYEIPDFMTASLDSMPWLYSPQTLAAAYCYS